MKITVLISLIFLLLFGGCSNDDNNELPEESLENFETMGSTLNDILIIASFQSAVYLDGSILVATSKGIKKLDLSEKSWSSGGLDNLEVISIYRNPANGKLFAGINSNSNSNQRTLYLSEDGGQNWFAAEDIIFDSLDNKFENYYCFAVHPSKPNNIYANLGGDMIAISTDGGLNWNRSNYAVESNFGYESYIAFMQNDPTKIYQGSENPLDDAWLAHYSIDPNDPVLLSDYTQIVTRSEWGNRRPNEMQSYSFAPDVLYVGQEGALSKVTSSGFEYIYLAGDGEEGNGGVNFPYSYITAFWVNKFNPDHLLFGGYINSESQPLSLYETYDEGNNIKRFDIDLGLDNPEVREIVDTDEEPVIVLYDREAKKIKLLKYLMRE